MQQCAVADEVKWEKGCVSGAVYWGDETLTNLLVKVCIFFYVSTHFKHQFLTPDFFCASFSCELFISAQQLVCLCKYLELMQTILLLCRYMEILHGATHFTRIFFLVSEKWRLRLWEWLAHFSTVDPTPAAPYVKLNIRSYLVPAVNRREALTLLTLWPGYFRGNGEHTDGLQGVQRHGVWTWCQIPWNVRGAVLDMIYSRFLIISLCWVLYVLIHVSALCSLAPVSVHAAFDKAAHYFGMKLVHIPLDKKTMKVDVKVRTRSKRTVGAGCDS